MYMHWPFDLYIINICCIVVTPNDVLSELSLFYLMHTMLIDQSCNAWNHYAMLCNVFYFCDNINTKIHMQ